MKNLLQMSVLQKINTVIFLLLFTSKAFACDVCSCGASNNSVFTNAIHGNFIGMTYNHMYFQYKEGISEDSPKADDYINTVTVTGQYQINDRFLVNTNVPYRFNYRNTSEEEVSIKGVGDVSITGLASVLNKNSSHTLKLGVGLKLPTGKFDLEKSESNKTSSTQLGTGSLDILLPMQYAYAWNQFSFNVNATYFIKNTNSEEFKYGNQTQINTSVAYSVPLKNNYIISPYVGLSYDDFEASERFEIIDKRTSGYMTNTNFGIQMESERIIVGVNSQVSLNQNLIAHEVTFNYGLGVFGYWRF